MIQKFTAAVLTATLTMAAAAAAASTSDTAEPQATFEEEWAKAKWQEVSGMENPTWTRFAMVSNVFVRRCTIATQDGEHIFVRHEGAAGLVPMDIIRWRITTGDSTQPAELVNVEYGDWNAFLKVCGVTQELQPYFDPFAPIELERSE